MNPADRSALRPLRRLTGDAAGLRRLLDAVRRHDDDAILEALSENARRAGPDDLAAEVRAILAPILAPAREKAAALTQAMSSAAGEPAPKVSGFAAAVRLLEKRHGAASVRAAAAALIAAIAAAAGRDAPP